MTRILTTASIIISLNICCAALPQPVLLLDQQTDGPAIPLLQREIARQAVAQVFRDDLGYLCRDRALGAPAESPADLTVRFEFGQPSEHSLSVNLTGGPKGRETWNAVLETGNYLLLLEQACTEAANLATPRKSSGYPEKLPGQAAADSPRLTDLIDLLRTAHAEHLQNPSADSYALLIRGYAHLGQRCAHTWSASSKVYQARSLVYAQRFLREHPDSADALYLRAYALGLCGLHQLALNDLEAGKALQRKEPPSWMQPLECLLKFDTDALIETANSEHPQCVTAGLMAMMTLEYTPFDSRIFETYDRLNTKPDENLRVLALLNEAGGVRAMHKTTMEGLEQMKLMLRNDLLNHDLLPLRLQTY
ncbi:hypothetical protein EGM51_17690 [Verrucomicrobia bacterium S94]|nr:hypothetical protein EGM51_17690 [Verrucomicrobia bacterium S94]